MLDASSQTHTQVSRYRPLLELGRGGMARVYLAESMTSGLHKLVVLKVLNHDLASDPEMRGAFAREAKISALLNHPNIVNVFEVFQQGDAPVMVMQYLDGLALSEVVRRLRGRIPLKLHLSILCQLLDALHYVHELKTADGVSLECVHRDVSPHNVMVLHEGGIKVVDFGVAKVRLQSESQSRAGVIKGKISYMPPEQLLSCAAVDRRADVYSVGVMLWEAVAGRRMWSGGDISSKVRAIMHGETPPIRLVAPGTSEALVRIIERALARAPEARYQTAQEMQLDLERAMQAEGGFALPRELAAFMRAHFGEDRRTRRLTIEQALHTPEMAAWVPAQDRGWEADTEPLSSPSQPRAAPGWHWSTGILASAVVVTAAALGVRLLRMETAAPPERAAPGQVEPAARADHVTLDVRTVPVGAEVFLDGTRLGVGPLSHRVLAEAKTAEIEVRASGHLSAHHWVNLHSDVELGVTLLPQSEDGLAETGEGSLVASSEAGDGSAGDWPGEARAGPAARAAGVGSTKRGRSAGLVRRRSQRSLRSERTAGWSPRLSAERGQADTCTPPYRLDPAGIKIFKPQCF